MDAHVYRRKAIYYVLAWQYFAGYNEKDIPEWLIEELKELNAKTYIFNNTAIFHINNEVKAIFSGDWIVMESDGNFNTFSGDEFYEKFENV